jgi:quinol-cytochrome oxidoreductase complex cytochrome b subunit
MILCRKESSFGRASYKCGKSYLFFALSTARFRAFALRILLPWLFRSSSVAFAQRSFAIVRITSLLISRAVISVFAMHEP